MTTLCLLLALSQDWAQFRGPDQGRSAEKGLPATWSATQNLAWKTELPGAGTSSPILVGDKIYVTSYSGYNVPGNPGDANALKLHLSALDRKTGKLLWTKDVAPKLPEQAKIRDEHGYASSTPASDGKKIYCFFGKSGAKAFDLQGKELWSADLGGTLHGWGSAASPVLHGKLVLVNASVESGTLYALDADTGKEVWKAGGIKESWSTPVVATSKEGRAEILVPIQGKIFGLDPKNGAQLWSCDTQIPWYMVPAGVTADGVAYWIGGRSGGAFAVRLGGSGDVSASHRVWTAEKNSNVPSPIFHAGHLYFAGNADGIAYCLEASSGKTVYAERLPRADTIYASPILADGKIYYTARNGRTFVVAAAPKFELLGTNDLNDGSLFHAAPVAADKRLFIRSNKALFCLAGK
jgi:outer membrane protein assembly factor BamB